MTLLGQHVFRNTANVVDVGHIALAENLFTRLSDFIEIPGRTGFHIPVFLRPVPADQVVQLIALLVVFAEVITRPAPVAVPYRRNRVIARCYHVINIGYQLAVLVDHHTARFIVHLLGSLLNMIRCCPHRPLNARQRDAIGRRYAAGPAAKTRQRCVDSFFAVELDKVGAGQDPPVEFSPQFWLKVVERKPGYALVPFQRASATHLQIVRFSQVPRDHRHVVVRRFTLGSLPDDDKTALLMLCYAMVFPSHLRSEAFGISLLEAAMFGKPLISCEIGTGTTYINIAGKTGVVIPPCDAKALAQAMIMLWENPGVSVEMGRQAALRFEQVFTADRMVEGYAKVYRDLLR